MDQIDTIKKLQIKLKFGVKDKNQIHSVRTGFDLDPKRERIQVHIAQTMNL